MKEIVLKFKLLVLILLLLPFQTMLGSEDSKVTNYPADKFGYPSHQFPAEVVVTKK